jgi:hypothetical protein
MTVSIRTLMNGLPMVLSRSGSARVLVRLSLRLGLNLHPFAARSFSSFMLFLRQRSLLDFCIGLLPATTLDGEANERRSFCLVSSPITGRIVAMHG